MKFIVNLVDYIVKFKLIKTIEKTRRGVQNEVSHGSCLSENAKDPVQSKPGQGNPFLFFNLLGNVYSNMSLSLLKVNNKFIIRICEKNQVY